MHRKVTIINDAKGRIAAELLALWFYILVFDRNGTDPVKQKNLRFTEQYFLRPLEMCFSFFQNWAIKYLSYPQF
jgi:hypothetical protein